MKSCGLPVERCNGGEPIIAPTERWWETGVTFNAAAVYLARSPANDPIMGALLGAERLADPHLAHGAVAIHYRARPEEDPASEFARSFIGLAVFTPDLELLDRRPEPVMSPAAEADGFDVLGVEDPRITRFGDQFYMVYCGLARGVEEPIRPQLCLARSHDLVAWQKLGPMPGDVNRTFNKDGVLFPDVIDGRYYLLHRPAWPGAAQGDLVMNLASSKGLMGPWQDLGQVLRAYPNPAVRTSWVGAGSVPILIGPNRYLEIYHTGNYLNEVDREYDLGAAIFDFNRFDPARPSAIVTARLEPLMAPETPAELRSRSRLQVGNVLFACGSYEYDGYIYIIYGGADTYTLAARVRRAALVEATEKAGLRNPFLTG